MSMLPLLFNNDTTEAARVCVAHLCSQKSRCFFFPSLSSLSLASRFLETSLSAAHLWRGNISFFFQHFLIKDNLRIRFAAHWLRRSWKCCQRVGFRATRSMFVRSRVFWHATRTQSIAVAYHPELSSSYTPLWRSLSTLSPHTVIFALLHVSVPPVVLPRVHN